MKNSKFPFFFISVSLLLASGCKVTSLNIYSEQQKVCDITQNIEHRYYYKKTLRKFQENLGSLTDKELLLGIAGFYCSPLDKKITAMASERDILVYTFRDDNLPKALEIVDDYIKKRPYSLMAHAALIQKEKLENPNINIEEHAYFRILNALKSSGDGSRENPYLMISTYHKVIMINYFYEEWRPIEKGDNILHDGLLEVPISYTEPDGNPISKSIFFNTKYL